MKQWRCLIPSFAVDDFNLVSWRWIREWGIEMFEHSAQEAYLLHSTRTSSSEVIFKDTCDAEAEGWLENSQEAMRDLTYHLAHSKFLYPCYQLWWVLLTREPTFLLYKKRLSKDASPKSQSCRTWSSGRLHAELTGQSEWVAISPPKSTGASLAGFTGWGGGMRQGRTTTNSRQIAKRGWGWLRW